MKVLSSHLPAPDAPNGADDVLKTKAHCTAAQVERRQHGACFSSMINAVRSSADTAQDFKDQRAFSSRAASTRRKASASLQGLADFCFASSLDTTQIHCKPSRTSRLPSPATSQEVGCADRLKQRQMCFPMTLCQTCVANSFRPANMRYLQVGQRVSVARYVCAV